MNEYAELMEKVGRYRRNAEQMTPEQLERYKPALDALRGEIHAHAESVMAELLLSGLRFGRDDCAEPMRRVAQIMGNSETKTAMARAEDALLSGPEGDAFLAELLPTRLRVLREGYGPYWTAHCKSVSDGEFSHYNDLVDLYRSERWRVWMSRDKTVFGWMPPPAMEQIEEECRRMLAEMKEDRDADPDN